MKAHVKFQLWAPLRRWITGLDRRTQERYLRSIIERTVTLYRQANGEKHTCKHPRSVRFTMDMADPLFVAWDNIEYTTRVTLLNVVARDMEREHEREVGMVVGRVVNGDLPVGNRGPSTGTNAHAVGNTVHD